MSDLVEFRHLKYIVAVAELGNFTRAAERLFLAQPSLSKQIKEMEDEIGFPIFVRSREGVGVTPAGQMIVSYAQEALMARAEIIKAASALQKGELLPFRLGFSSFVKPGILDLFRESYASLFPECRIHLSGGDPTQIVERLKRGSLDGAFLPMPIDGKELRVLEISRDPLVACMRADDPIAREPEISVSDLASRLKVFRDPQIHPAAHRRLIEMLLEVGINPELTCSATTPADIQTMVRAGYGLALTDQSSTLDEALTTRTVAGVEWTADTAFVHGTTANHLALPFAIRLMHGWRKAPAPRRATPLKERRPRQLNLLA